jgi:Transglycosylase SLT domain
MRVGITVAVAAIVTFVAVRASWNEDDRAAPPPAAAGAYFATLPPASALPSGAACASRVRRHRWEPRPENFTANHTTGRRVGPIEGASAEANRKLVPRIDGSFTGTTDEIIQWGACKWGLDEDILRAMAVVESNWYQSAVGDNGQSFGLFQIKATAHPGTFPASRDSTAFNVDHAAAGLRLCYEGHLWSPSSRGDLWGCVGSHYSGAWMDARALGYVAAVKRHYNAKAWEEWGL